MKVKIKSCSIKDNWYSDKIGEEVEIETDIWGMPIVVGGLYYEIRNCIAKLILVEDLER